MPANDGDRPGGAPPSPTNPPDGPPRRTYSTIGAGGRLKVRALLASTFQEVLAEMEAEYEAALAEAEHVKAA